MQSGVDEGVGVAERAEHFPALPPHAGDPHGDALHMERSVALLQRPATKNARTIQSMHGVPRQRNHRRCT